MSETTEVQAAASEFVTLEVVYLGRRLLSEGICAAYILANDVDAYGAQDDWGLERRASLFGGKQPPGLTIGVVYQVEGAVRDGRVARIRATAEKPQRQLTEHPLFSAWTLSDETARRTDMAAKAAKRAAENTGLTRALDVLGAHMARLPPSQQNAFRLMVLNRLDGKH